MSVPEFQVNIASHLWVATREAAIAAESVTGDGPAALERAKVCALVSLAASQAGMFALMFEQLHAPARVVPVKGIVPPNGGR